MLGTQLDSISLEILRARLTSAVDEAATTLIRTAYSNVIRDAKDFTVCLLDRKGRLVAQATQSIPVFLGTIPRTAQLFIAYLGQDKLRPGDVLITNDPWIGSGHLPDVNMLVGVYDPKCQDTTEPVAYVCVVAHMADIGGALLSGDAHDVFEEGIRIPITYLMRQGNMERGLLDVIRGSVRVPDSVLGDIDAMLGAANVASSRLQSMLGGDPAGLDKIVDALKPRSLQAMMNMLQRVPPGDFTASSIIEDGDSSIKLAVKVTFLPGNQGVVVDFEGTSPQSLNGRNATFGYTQAYTHYAFKCAFLPRTPTVEGAFDSIQVRAPERTVLNSLFPAAVGGRHVVGQSVVPLLFKAMGAVVPGHTMAESGSPRPFVTISGNRINGDRFSMALLVTGGLGGRAMKDGISALSFPSNTETTDLEALESNAPLVFEEKQLMPDSAGFGRHRGGFGQRAVLRALKPLRISAIAAHTRYAPEGVDGGGEGGKARLQIVRKDGTEITFTKTSVLEVGDRLIVESAGGAGYGRVTDRDPELLTRDRDDGYFLNAGS